MSHARKPKSELPPRRTFIESIELGKALIGTFESNRAEIEIMLLERLAANSRSDGEVAFPIAEKHWHSLVDMFVQRRLSSELQSVMIRMLWSRVETLEVQIDQMRLDR